MSWANSSRSRTATSTMIFRLRSAFHCEKLRQATGGAPGSDQQTLLSRQTFGNGAEPLAATTRPSALHCTTLKDCW